jgi:protein regulator of cytokinesis 1
MFITHFILGSEFSVNILIPFLIGFYLWYNFFISLQLVQPLQLQELASQLIDLWNLMDTPPEERKLFDHVTCNISASVDEVTIPGALALDLIEQVLKTF